MTFDPNAPFEVVDAPGAPPAAAGGFDPNAPFEVVDAPQPSAMRGLGLGARGVIAGAVDTVRNPAAAVLNAPSAILNDLAGRQVIPEPFSYDQGQSFADMLGLPRPASPTEQVLDRVVQGGAGMVGPMLGARAIQGGAAALGPLVRPATPGQAVVGALANSPGTDIAAGAVGGAAGGLIEQSGGGVLPQVAGDVAGNILTAAIIAAVARRRGLNPQAVRPESVTPEELAGVEPEVITSYRAAGLSDQEIRQALDAFRLADAARQRVTPSATDVAPGAPPVGEGAMSARLRQDFFERSRGPQAEPVATDPETGRPVPLPARQPGDVAPDMLPRATFRADAVDPAQFGPGNAPGSGALVPVEPQPNRMTPGDITRAQAEMRGGNPNTAEPPSRLIAPEGRLPQTPDQAVEQRQAAGAFDQAAAQRGEVAPGVRDTQPAPRPEGVNPQTVYLDQGFPVRVLGRDDQGFVSVERYDPRTNQPAEGAVPYVVRESQLDQRQYAAQPRAAQDFVARSESPRNPEVPREPGPGRPVQEPGQTFRATSPDANQDFPGAGSGRPPPDAQMGRSPFPDQPDGPAPGQRWSTAEDAERAFQARRAQADAEAARARESGEWNSGQRSTNQPGAQDADGRWPTGPGGYVASSAGGPIRFADQKQAARWIISQGQAKSPDQFFEIAVHPSGQGFTVREAGRNAGPGASSSGTAGGNARGGAAPEGGAPPRSTPEPQQPEASPRRIEAPVESRERPVGDTQASSRGADDTQTPSSARSADGTGDIPSGKNPAQEGRSAPESSRAGSDESSAAQGFARGDRVRWQTRAGETLTGEYLGRNNALTAFVRRDGGRPDIVLLRSLTREDIGGDNVARLGDRPRNRNRVLSSSRGSGEVTPLRRPRDGDDSSAARGADRTEGSDGRLYANPLADPDAWKRFLADPITGTVRSLRGKLESTVSSIGREPGVGAAWKLYADSARATLLGFRERYPGVKGMAELVDNLGATDPGSGRAVKAGIQEAADAQARSLNNRVANMLSPLGNDAAALGRVRDLLTGANPRGASQAERDAARRLRTLLDEHHAWLTKRLGSAEKEMGYVRGRYFPRRFDAEAIQADTAGFVTDATALYRRTGLDADQARFAAEEWANRVMGIGGAARYADTPASSYTKGRTLPADADQAMRKWLVTDPREALSGYFEASTRHAEFVSRFGANGEKLDEVMAGMRKEGATVTDLAILRRSFAAATGTSQGAGHPTSGLMSWVQMWGMRQLLTRALFSSAAEPIATGIRSGDLRDSGRALFDTWKRFLTPDRWEGDTARMERERAEMMGVIGDASREMLMAARVEGQNLRARDANRINQMLAITGQNRLFAASRIAASRVAEHTVARLLDSDGKLAARSLAEMGLDDATASTVRAWMKKHDGRPPVAELLSDTPAATAYRAAVNRFVNEAIANPLAVDKPTGAGERHPMAQLGYSIMSFQYAFTRNVLIRTFKQGGDALTQGGFSAGERAAMLVPVLGLMALAGAQAGASNLRDTLFNRQARRERPPFVDVTLMLDRAGLFGNLSPLVNLVTSARYERDASGALVGAYLGNMLRQAGDIFPGTLPPSMGGPNSPRTNNSEWAATRAAWGLIAAPVAVGALAAAPIPSWAKPAAGAAAMYVGSSDASRSVATAVAGPRTTQSRTPGARRTGPQPLR